MFFKPIALLICSAALVPTMTTVRAPHLHLPLLQLFVLLLVKHISQQLLVINLPLVVSLSMCVIPVLPVANPP